MLDRTNCGAGAIVSVCAVVLLPTVLSLTGGNEATEAQQGGGGYPSDLYDRPPGLKGDELSDFPLGIIRQSEFDINDRPLALGEDGRSSNSPSEFDDL